MPKLEQAIRKNLNLSTVKAIGGVDRGCISAGRHFETEIGPIFVKTNEKHGAETMFLGEQASLNAILATGAIHCPKPLGAFSVDDSWALAMTYIEMGFGFDEKELARRLAHMHLSNAQRLAVEGRGSTFLGGDDEVLEECLPTNCFGFPITTCCGFISQPNNWTAHWDEFFIRNRLQYQIDLLIEKGDRDINELWPQLQITAAELLRDASAQVPSLIHGDLWSGNWGFSAEGPVMFDPASFYGDAEYEQGIMNMFGGLSPAFWTEYHKIVPVRPGRENRVLLYELFHHLNHWNHFGSSYKGSSINLIRKILSL